MVINISPDIGRDPMTALAQVLTHRSASHLERNEKGVLRLTRSYLASDAEPPF